MLVDRDTGLVGDTTLGVSWLKDAGLVKSSCEANDTLWQAFDPESVPGSSGRTKAQICGLEGRLNWYEAQAWIALLNARNYLGYNDWRLPVVGPVNGVRFEYRFVYDGSTDLGYNISAPGSAYPGSTSSELAHLHYSGLHNGGWYAPDGTNQQDRVCPVPRYCVQNTGPFHNLQPFQYWSGTEVDSVPTHAWLFSTYNGFQYHADKAGFMNVWPVRSGLPGISPIAVPALDFQALLLTGIALLALAAGGLSRQRKDQSGVR